MHKYKGEKSFSNGLFTPYANKLNMFFVFCVFFSFCESNLVLFFPRLAEHMYVSKNKREYVRTIQALKKALENEKKKKKKYVKKT